MSEDEINEAFEAVINDAAAADAEESERWMQAYADDIAGHLDNGDVVIDVYEHPRLGDRYVGIPADVMVELLNYLNEFVSFNHMVGHQAELGNAAVLLEPIMSEICEKSATVKSAFIMMALVKHNEQEINRVAQDIVRDILGEAWS